MSLTKSRQENVWCWGHGETGLFGLNQGSFMVNYGGTDTQQAAILFFQKMVTTRALFSTGMLEVSGTEDTL